MLKDSEVSIIIEASICYNEVFRKAVSRHVSKPQLTKSQFDILSVLALEGPMNMSGISNKLAIAKEQVTRLIKPLREQQLVSCEKDPDNRRRVIVSMTPTGNEFIEKQREIARRLLRKYLEVMSEDDQNALVAHSREAMKILLKYDFFPIEHRYDD